MRPQRRARYRYFVLLVVAGDSADGVSVDNYPPWTVPAGPGLSRPRSSWSSVVAASDYRVRASGQGEAGVIDTGLAALAGEAVKFAERSWRRQRRQRGKCRRPRSALDAYWHLSIPRP